MATYYVRKTGSDGNAGTSAGAAWLTIGKALGASGISSGDTVYVGAGTYRETVTVNMTSAVAETFVIADIDGRFTGDTGEVRLTAFTTNDKTAPSSNVTINFAGKDYLSFYDFVFVGGANTTASIFDITTTASKGVNCTRCTFLPGSTTTIPLINITGTTSGGNGEPLGMLYNQCRFLSCGQPCILITMPQAVEDYDILFAIRSCLFVGGYIAADGFISLLTTGSDLGKPGKADVSGCTVIGGESFVRIGTGWSTTIKHGINSCLLIGANLYSSTTNQADATQCLIYAATPLTNITTSITNITNGSYATRFSIGQEWPIKKQHVPPFAPLPDSPMLGFSTFGESISSPSRNDVNDYTRPSGVTTTFNNVGASDLINFGVKDTSTFFSAAPSMRLTGYGLQQFDLPVYVMATRISINARYNSSYSGQLPRMAIVQCEEAGVTAASVSMTASADTWEELSLTFTPTKQGIIKVRLYSLSTTGNAYFDNFIMS